MADCLINVFLTDDDMKKLDEAGLADQLLEVEGKKAIQVPMSKKDQKKLLKGFPDLTFDEANACALPDDAQKQLLDIVLDLKTLDVMKFAITKLYNPLAGKSLRSKTF
ncbi:MAG: hypothetical protein PVG49_16180 [Desulfobacteraceae bacterium]|jgi:hypothetical protein